MKNMLLQYPPYDRPERTNLRSGRSLRISQNAQLQLLV